MPPGFDCGKISKPEQSDDQRRLRKSALAGEAFALSVLLPACSFALSTLILLAFSQIVRAGELST
jgi:hypothetical protein